MQNVAVSTSSACHSGGTRISSILHETSVSWDEASATIMLSLGRFTTDEEIETLVKNLRGLENTAIK